MAGSCKLKVLLYITNNAFTLATTEYTQKKFWSNLRGLGYGACEGNELPDHFCPKISHIAK
jgi:hypothetical protein